ncbi:MAG: pseudouridine synthase, partial [Chloroflexus sp.]|uniref:pseudouridine synthase n=1 Tax=Chloroflexus sp. TaxID=1904827 RepID=UPI003D147798
MSPERLQKVLASAGIASRRDCEELIAAGRVTVNGRVVTVPGTRVDLEHDEILVDGQPLRIPAKRTYIMLHKPAGVVSTAEDTHGRPTVVELVDVPARVFPVGRLDLDSEGLILLTDDGELAYALTHPSFEVEKEYRVLLDRALTPDALRSWRNGVLLEGEMTAPAWVELLETTPEGVWVRIVLREGRKRQIRVVAKLLGYEVRRLIRVREGPLQLGDLPPRAWRHLTDEEVAALRAHVSVRRSLADAPTRPTDVVKSRALDEKSHHAGASAPVTRQRSEQSERRIADRSPRTQRDERFAEGSMRGERDTRAGRAPRGRQDSRGEAGRGAWDERDARTGRAPRGRQDEGSRGEAGRGAW